MKDANKVSNFDANLDAALAAAGIKNKDSSDEVRSILTPEDAAQQIRNLMIYAENESVRLRAAELSLKISGFNFGEDAKIVNDNKSITINIIDKNGTDEVGLFDLLLPRSAASFSTAQHNIDKLNSAEGGEE